MINAAKGVFPVAVRMRVTHEGDGVFEEAKYFAKQTARWATLKGVINGGTRMLASAVGRASPWWSGTVITLGAASTAVLAHFDYRHQLSRIGRFYREEIAAKLGVEPAQVDIDAVKKVAYGDAEKNIHANPTIAHEVALAKRHRWLKIGVSVLASALAVATVIALAPALTGFLASGIGMALIGGVAGFISGQVLGTVGEQVIGLHKHRPHSVINDIRHHRRGDNIVTPEQVMEVLVAAKPGLDDIIKQQYGARYHKLSPAQQTVAMQQYDATFHISQLTKDINNRQVRVTELAFIAYNQHSGVPRLPEPPLTAAERAAMKTRMAVLRGREEAHRIYENGKQMAGHLMESSRERAQQAMEYGAEKFQTMTARARQLLSRGQEAQEERPAFLQQILEQQPQESSRSFTEKIEFSKAAPALNPFSR